MKTLIFCGQQNIPLQGHRDDGQLSTNSVINDGNFRALLRFRIDAGDEILEIHLKNSSSRATYISKTTQNALIDCCRLEILEIILERVQNAGFFAIMFDESTDISGKAQISLVLRYVSINETSTCTSPCIREDFVTFVDAFGELTASSSNTENSSEDAETDSRQNEEDSNPELSLTGSAFAKLVLKEMRDMNLELQNCVGIGTDNCSTMLGEKNGAVKNLVEVLKNAVSTPCYNHKLNLSLSVSLKVLIVAKATSVIEEVTFFFKHYSPKRNTVLAQVLGKRLVQLCETRWVERHDAVLIFTHNLPEIIETFTRIDNWKDKQATSIRGRRRLWQFGKNIILDTLCPAKLHRCICLSTIFRTESFVVMDRTDSALL